MRMKIKNERTKKDNMFLKKFLQSCVESLAQERKLAFCWDCIFEIQCCNFFYNSTHICEIFGRRAGKCNGWWLYFEWHAFQTLWETNVWSWQHFLYFSILPHMTILGTALKPAICRIFFLRMTKFSTICEIISNKKIYAILYRETSSKSILRS